ncbi:MAG TPA: glycoside hydrolase family 38 C-terminal domain-containing protein [Candidatus Baltobacteraceae bacterium]|nr:glycoside hydrolase family 38 C-terminal domain-containing protein [Candidatus Baltobacteraceae bacterium]
MRLRLIEREREDGIATFFANLEPQTAPVSVKYKTWTGALLRVDGVAAGAFDREHHEVVLPAADRERVLKLDVELHALPTNGLPSGPGLIWWFLNKRAYQTPARTIDVEPVAAQTLSGRDSIPPRDGLMLLGHSHLDVAWLWTYEQTRRKAERTFAIACDLLDRDPEFVFIQSQPQLYAFVEEGDPALFARVEAHVASGRFDPSVAALWVESDCNIPSGESLLRQMIYARRYCEEHFGITPRIAWLPDTFGFANTLPQLLAHAGIPYFSTTKLNWNDTTKFPYPQFVWEGPDGSTVVSALITSYDGGPYPWRIVRARERHEPLVLGYGDGGGGVTPGMLDQARRIGEWIHPVQWFERLQAARTDLPTHKDELYLEYHRGVYTTHHDVKFHNALLERALAEAEELTAWCHAVHAPRATVEQLQARLRAVWEVVLRNQFHDVIPGTSIEPVYDDVSAEYAQAEDVVASVIAAAQAMLPRATRAQDQRLAAPSEHEGEIVFENASLSARLRPNGTIVELTSSGRSVQTCTQGNVLALYRDKPKEWEAWNVDRDYTRRMQPAKPGESEFRDDGLSVQFMLGRSPAVMRISLGAADAFLRVELDVEWNERRTLLRVENWLPLQATHVRYGTPHGTVDRSTLAATPQDRAKFEVPGQRFAAIPNGNGDGMALFALDTYGWSARTLPKGGIRLGHSLLRGTTWPDPVADIGKHRLSYAFAPLHAASNATLERLWERFAHGTRVRLFVPEQANALISACKLAEDGDGVVVRVRECDGTAGPVAIRCAARMTEAIAIDAVERAVDRDAAIEGELLRFQLRPYELRSFRVRFSHA